jgi:FlaA1/EpsC-like NDP-sugar epimerase
LRKRIVKIFWHYRRGFVIVFHACLAVFAYVASFMIRFDFDVPSSDLGNFYSRLPLFVAVQMVVFDFFNLYAGMWRFVNALDIWNIVKANTLAVICCILTDVIVFHLGNFPRSIFLADWVLCIALLSGARLGTRLLREHFSRVRQFDPDAKRVLIVGAGEAGALLLQEYRRKPDIGNVVGFIDDDRNKQNLNIHGIKILGPRENIPKVVDEQDVDEVVIAVPSADGTAVRSILSYCQQTKAKIKVVPGLSKILSGEMEVKPREVLPEDLLGRETVEINTDEIGRYLKGRTVLVTGAGGSIGYEICLQIAGFGPKELVLLDHYENQVYFLTVELQVKHPSLMVKTCIGDVRDVGLIKNIFSRYHPHVVFHAAAHKHVPLMESSPAAAVKNNVFGTRNLIYAADHYHVERFVFISTDKAVNPINVMGMSKRVAEMVLQAKAARSCTKFMAVRFGNVLGSAGSVVPLFKSQIEKGGPITVTHPDAKRYFMSIKEAAMLVLQAGALGKGGELFILDMGDQIKIASLAKSLIALSGFTPDKDIVIKFTGLRPGEKLEEELFLDKEKDSKTKHNKIFISRSNGVYDGLKLNRDLKKLHRLTELMDETNILKMLKEIVNLGQNS